MAACNGGMTASPKQQADLRWLAVGRGALPAAGHYVTEAVRRNRACGAECLRRRGSSSRCVRFGRTPTYRSALKSYTNQINRSCLQSEIVEVNSLKIIVLDIS